LSSDDSGSQGKALVGYGKPPVERRFKKGTSGNPNGRPRKKPPTTTALTIGELVLKEAYRPIQIRENDKVITMPMIQAVIRSLGVAAVKGSLRAQMAIASMVETVERRAQEEHNLHLEVAMDYKKSWNEVFEACDRRGEPRPEPIPHPDEIEFDLRTGQIIYNGPMDEIQNAHWEKMFERQRGCLEEIAYTKKQLKREPGLKGLLERDIEIEQDLYDLIGSLFPDKETRRRSGFNIHDWREREKKFYEIKSRFRKARRVGG
jgi:hypothetical protein